MITKLEVFSSQPDAPVIALAGFVPSGDPVQIRNVEGIGPVKSDIASAPFASGRGEQYLGGVTGKRNIVLSLGLNPDWQDQTMSTLRQLLYRYFMPETWIKLRWFSDHLPTVDIEGYVESFEPNMFSQDPEIQISIICPKPDFVEVDATIIYGVVDDGTTKQVFNYIGTIETGYELRIESSEIKPAYSGNINIWSTAFQEKQYVILKNITIDDTKYFRFSSVRNAKRVSSVAIADGVATNLLAKMSKASVWPVLKPGENLIAVVAAESGQNWTMVYYNKFGGL